MMDTKTFRTELLIKRLSKIYPNNFSAELKDIKSINPRKILIIAPHADDEVIGCTATVDYFGQKGAHISVLVVTRESSRSIAKSYDYSPEQRVEESYMARTVLGYDDLIYFDFPELMLRSDQDLQRRFRKELTTLILNCEPDCIFIPNKKEMHPDHQVIGKLAEETILKGLQEKMFNQLDLTIVYEIWGPVMMNSFIEISDAAYIKKIAGIRCYKSQLSSVDYEEIIQFLATTRGKDLMLTRPDECRNGVRMTEGYKLYSSEEILNVGYYV